MRRGRGPREGVIEGKVKGGVDEEGKGQREGVVEGKVKGGGR